MRFWRKLLILFLLSLLAVNSNAQLSPVYALKDSAKLISFNSSGNYLIVAGPNLMGFKIKNDKLVYDTTIFAFQQNGRISISPDGKLLARSLPDSSQIYVYKFSAGLPLLYKIKLKGYVQAYALTDKYLVAGIFYDDQYAIQLYDFKRKKVLAGDILSQYESFKDMQVSADGQYILFTTYNYLLHRYNIYVYHYAGGYFDKTVGLKNLSKVSAAVFANPKGKYIAALVGRKLKILDNQMNFVGQQKVGKASNLWYSEADRQLVVASKRKLMFFSLGKTINLDSVKKIKYHSVAMDFSDNRKAVFYDGFLKLQEVNTSVTLDSLLLPTNFYKIFDINGSQALISQARNTYLLDLKDFRINKYINGERFTDGTFLGKKVILTKRGKLFLFTDTLVPVDMKFKGRILPLVSPDRKYLVVWSKKYIYAFDQNMKLSQKTDKIKRRHAPGYGFGTDKTVFYYIYQGRLNSLELNGTGQSSVQPPTF